MIILIAGASHTGKTALAQKLLEKYHMPYLSIDHLKMGLIRSGNTGLTPMDSDDRLTEYLQEIRYYCLVMSEKYIRKHFADIKKYANVVEDRLDDSDCTMESVLADNVRVLEQCVENGCNYIISFQ